MSGLWEENILFIKHITKVGLCFPFNLLIFSQRAQQPLFDLYEAAESCTIDGESPVVYSL